MQFFPFSEPAVTYESVKNNSRNHSDHLENWPVNNYNSKVFPLWIDIKKWDDFTLNMQFKHCPACNINKVDWLIELCLKNIFDVALLLNCDVFTKKTD